MIAEGRLLVVSAAETESAARLRDTSLRELERHLHADDVLVVNDAATLPASLHGHAGPSAAAVEVRLLGMPADTDAPWRAVLFGPGDFRTRTEDRAAPPVLELGARLRFGALEGRVAARSPLSPRLIEIEFDLRGAALWAALYREGHPVQYAHQPQPLPLYSIQTAYAGRPWAAEMPSAGWPLRWALLGALRKKGVQLHALTHAAGLSATGDPAIDAALPLPERYEIPESTATALARAHGRGARVIAVGTSVVRALEGAVRTHGELRAGSDVTDLVIDADFVPRVVDGLLTGVHDPSESHFRLLQAFAPAAQLLAALQHASSTGYRNHEFGDSMLLLSSRRSARLAALAA